MHSWSPKSKRAAPRAPPLQAFRPGVETRQSSHQGWHDVLPTLLFDFLLDGFETPAGLSDCCKFSSAHRIAPDAGCRDTSRLFWAFDSGRHGTMSLGKREPQIMGIIFQMGKFPEVLKISSTYISCIPNLVLHPCDVSQATEAPTIQLNPYATAIIPMSSSMITASIFSKLFL